MRIAALTLAALALVAALVTLDTLSLHLLPLGFEGTAVYGSIAVVGGLVLSLSSLFLSAVVWRRAGSVPSSLRLSFGLAALSLVAILVMVALHWQWHAA